MRESTPKVLCLTLRCLLTPLSHRPAVPRTPPATASDPHTPSAPASIGCCGRTSPPPDPAAGPRRHRICVVPPQAVGPRRLSTTPAPCASATCAVGTRAAPPHAAGLAASPPRRPSAPRQPASPLPTLFLECFLLLHRAGAFSAKVKTNDQIPRINEAWYFPVDSGLYTAWRSHSYEFWSQLVYMYKW
ncbi:hypothetical protein U9M48_042048 [Paspalum notatum var. saurae]|uniref:Uncharacterized protein n=1 Tax=Paspalum notatum var. saurae TaxID=547442 RepID=A0AAQ3UPR6_PASNO